MEKSGATICSGSESRIDTVIAINPNGCNNQCNIQSFPSPIQNFPFEILECIFSNYDRLDNEYGCHGSIAHFPYEDSDDGDPGYVQFAPGAAQHYYQVTRLSNGPWRIGQVCSYWRDVVLSSPCLWSNLDFGQYANVPPDCTQLRGADHLQYLIEEGLRRSGSTPLSVTWDCNTLEGTLPFFRPHSSRLKCITIDGDYTLPLYLHLDMFQNYSLPMLESIILTQMNDGEYHNGQPIIAPNLRSVSLTNIHGPSNIPIPWKQITTLTHKVLDSEAYYSLPGSLLKRCPNLQSLHIGYLKSGKLFRGSLITQLSIQRLPWLDRLELPQIKVLSVNYIEMEFDNDLDDMEIDLYSSFGIFLDFVRRSSCSLHTLILELGDIKHFSARSAEMFLKCLSLLNTLTTLSLGMDWVEEGLETLAKGLILPKQQGPSNPVESVCPHLSELNLSVDISEFDLVEEVSRFCKGTLSLLVSSRSINGLTIESSRKGSSLSTFTFRLLHYGSEIQNAEGDEVLKKLLYKVKE